MVAMPIVVRQPLPGDLQADLDYVTHVLIVDSRIADCDVPAFRAEAILCLNGRRDLAEHVENQPQPRLRVIQGGVADGDQAI